MNQNNLIKYINSSGVMLINTVYCLLICIDSLKELSGPASTVDQWRSHGGGGARAPPWLRHCCRLNCLKACSFLVKLTGSDLCS